MRQIKTAVDELDISPSMLVEGKKVHKDGTTQRGKPRVTSYPDNHNKAWKAWMKEKESI